MVDDIVQVHDTCSRETHTFNQP